MIVYRRLINMVPGGQVAVVNMSQYDSDVTLEFELYASEGTFVVESGTTVLIRGTKPDGNGISLDGTLESTQDPETGQYVHLVTVEVTQQMTAVAGKALYELSLRKDNMELNTANFVLDIERAPLDADTVPSESVIREIDKAVEKYMDEHDIVIDDTLTQQGKAADAKAVRDALAAIEPGLSDDAKEALLACFEHVAWIDEHGQDYYDALAEALEVETGIRIKGSVLKNIAWWSQTYPYYTDSAVRLEYPNLDIPVVGGGIYQIKASANMQNLRMMVNVFNQNIANRSVQELSLDMSDKMDAYGWKSGLDQTILIPPKVNGSPVAGLIFGFKYSDESAINVGDVESILIKQKTIPELPSGYTEYDYISMAGTGTQTASNYTAFIKTLEYDNLANCSISADFRALTTIGNANLPIVGGRMDSNWDKVVAVYVINGTNTYSVHYHGANAIENAFTLGQVTHFDINRTDASPKKFVSEGVLYDSAWSYDTVVNCTLSLFSLNIKGSDSQSINFSNNIQLGKLTIIDANGNVDVYVPAVRDADNVIGIYNLNKNVFRTCQDVTKATIGNANCLYTVGSWS